MKRAISAFLDAWLAESGRKPLVMRGARQVVESLPVAVPRALSDS